MLVLIAESKTMTRCDKQIISGNRPLLADKVDEIMFSLKEMSSEELSKAVKISLPMARHLHEIIYEFDDKRYGINAIEAFTGVVFRAFNYLSLNYNDRLFANSHIRIISSLYGWLRPDDVIKDYRFDFTTKLAPDGRSFAEYWRSDATQLLIDELKNTKQNEILDLLPADARRQIDWSLINSVANVYRVDFKELVSANSYKTPGANRLKTLRGELLRQIVVNHIDNAGKVCSLESNHYVANGTIESGNVIEFITA